MSKYIFYILLFIGMDVSNLIAQDDEFGYLDPEKTVDWGDPIYDNFFSGLQRKS